MLLLAVAGYHRAVPSTSLDMSTYEIDKNTNKKTSFTQKEAHQ